MMPGSMSLLYRRLYLCFSLLIGCALAAAPAVLAAETSSNSRVYVFVATKSSIVSFQRLTTSNNRQYFLRNATLYLPPGAVYTMANGTKLVGEGVFDANTGAHADPAFLNMARALAEKLDGQFVESAVNTSVNENCASQPCA